MTKVREKDLQEDDQVPSIAQFVLMVEEPYGEDLLLG